MLLFIISSLLLPVDVSDYSQVAQAMEKFSPFNAIIHLAGNPSPKAGWEQVLSAKNEERL
jgi:hypothetical protein